MSKNLFEDSDDGSDNKDFQLDTNKEYAKIYNNLRKKELVKKFKDKDLKANDNDTSSDSSDSSEEDDISDPGFDREFFKTLASLKSKDPSIYDKNTKFFQNLSDGDNNSDDSKDDVTNKKGKCKKPKPVTVKDYERNILLEKSGKFEDDPDEEDSAETQKEKRAYSPSAVEEERHLKDEFRKVMAEEDSDEEEFGGIFKKRQKTKDELDKEEEDYLKWLAGKQDTIGEDLKQKLEPLKRYWNSDELPQSEKFLRDYILNKGYAKATNYSEIPTYDEIVGTNVPLSDDEKELEKQAEFEQKYNFRFEEPDHEFIKRYPRTIESTVRRSDEKRKQKRLEIKERKQQEKVQKMKELEMVKEMKRQEIMEKIRKLKLVTGNDELGFKEDELEEEFDPEAHDKRMEEIFNDDYYQVDEGEEKPQCPSDIEELQLEDWDNYDPTQDNGADESEYEPHCEDDDFNMDCDYDPVKAKEDLQKELIENTKKRKGRKGRHNRFKEIIKAEKPVFNPDDEKTYAEYIDEYYKLDCEDIIGDVPCRFKYTATTPNDFGLTIEEILLAKNKELNQWASLKKAVQIRPEQLEKKEQRLYKMKAKNMELKRKIFKSLYGEGSDEDENLDDKNETLADSKTTKPIAENSKQDEISKKSKKKRKRKNRESSSKAHVKDDGKNSLEPPTVEKPKLEESAIENGSAMQCNDQQTQQQLPNKKRKKHESKIMQRDDKNEFNETKGSSKSNNSRNPFAQSSFMSNVNDKKVTRKELGPTPLHRRQAKKKHDWESSSENKLKSKFGNKNNTFTSGKAATDEDGKQISDERLKAYGINPRKFHKKQKYGSKN
ncbi:protein KRI1 homolog isoform 1-T2 [Glossina fuscipes fuscipes]